MTASGVVVKDLKAAHGDSVVMSNFSMAVAAGESVAIMGPSGSGKTTLLSCITGMMTAQRGYVSVGPHVVSALGSAARSRFRRHHLGLVFQSPELLPELTVEENVAITLLFDGLRRPAALRAAARSLETVGLSGYGPRRTDELSGGEAQRVALARALVRPQALAIVADEPTASLDAANAASVADVLVERTRALGCVAIIATHDHNVAARCDRVVSLRNSPAAEALV